MANAEAENAEIESGKRAKGSGRRGDPPNRTPMDILTTKGPVSQRALEEQSSEGLGRVELRWLQAPKDRNRRRKEKQTNRLT